MKYYFSPDKAYVYRQYQDGYQVFKRLVDSLGNESYIHFKWVRDLHQLAVVGPLTEGNQEISK